MRSKEPVFDPMKNKHSTADYLETLIEDVFNHILSYTSLQDRINLSSTSKCLRDRFPSQWLTYGFELENAMMYSLAKNFQKDSRTAMKIIYTTNLLLNVGICSLIAINKGYSAVFSIGFCGVILGGLVGNVSSVCVLPTVLRCCLDSISNASLKASQGEIQSIKNHLQHHFYPVKHKGNKEMVHDTAIEMNLRT